MKRFLSHAIDIALYGAIAFALYSFVSRKLSGPSRGVEAAMFDLPVVGSEDSARFRLADHRGKPVLIEVFAGWCPACRSSAPAVVEAFRKHGARGTFVGVSMDSSDAEALRVKRDWGIPYDVVRDDGRLSKDYKIEVLPTFVLVGADGMVRHVSTGAPSRADLDRWLTEL